MDTKFAQGDLVQCVDNSGVSDDLTAGQVYTVERALQNYVRLEGVFGAWMNYRFVLAPTPIEPRKNTEDGIVTKPAHYARWTIEPVEFLMKNNVPGHIFNIVKYVMRAGFKLYPDMDAVQSEITDLKKASRYIEMRINLLEGKEVL